MGTLANFNSLQKSQRAETVAVGGGAEGNFYWPLSEAADFYYLFAFGDYGTVTTPISLAIGDTIEFEYLPVANSGSGNLIMVTSDDGLATFGYGADPTQQIPVVGLVGFTATLNGNSVVNGDHLPNNRNNDLNQVGRWRWQRVVLTATAATNFHRFCADTAGANPAEAGFRDLTVTTVGQTYKWSLINEAFGGSQPEDLADANDIVITSFSTSGWYEAALHDNAANPDSTEVFVPFTHSFDEEAIFYQRPSLRTDGQGFSKDVTNITERFIGDFNSGLRIPYEDGFTYETLIKYQTLITPHSTRGAGFDLTRCFGLWAFQFDNWDSGSLLTDPITPHLVLIKRGGFVYNDARDPTHVEVDIRGSVIPSLSDIIHVMFTLRTSDNTAEMWIDGVSQGTVSIPVNWWDNGAPGGVEDIKTPTATQGDSVLRFAYTGGAGLDRVTDMQDIRIHLLEADQAFADQQFAALSGTPITLWNGDGNGDLSGTSLIQGAATGVVPFDTIDGIGNSIITRIGTVVIGGHGEGDYNESYLNWEGFSDSVTDITSDGSNAEAGYELRSNGDLYKIKFPGNLTFESNWLQGSTVGSDYEVKLAGSATDTTNAIDDTTWHSLGSNITFSNIGNTDTSSTVTATIREVGAAVTEEVGLLTFRAVESEQF